jgi:tetratricopeptide (TPR) repeat protein
MVPILIGVFFLALVVIVFILVSGRTKGGGSGGGKRRAKNRDAKLQEANKRLAQDPLDPHALFNAGEIYFEEESWEKSMKAHETLVDLIVKSPIQGIDNFDVYVRYAISSLRRNMAEEAYKGFSMARALRQNSFEVNYNLGALEFERKNYEKAMQLLQEARVQNPENPGVLRYMGHALFRLKKPKEAMSYIRKAIDLAPDDKESLYTLAECYYEANQTEQALRIFSHLRLDPVMGPSACLISGTIHAETRQNERAILDFEMGLKHQEIRPDIMTDLRYYLATAYLKQSEIGKALSLLKLIEADNPNFKDTAMLIGKYQELNANQNLHIFLMASSADFIALCRKIVITYYPRAKVKVINISVNANEWSDILAEINTPKWTELIMFRFIRTQGAVGELVVRDFHSHLKEVKAGKGVCMTVGTFSEGARRYTEARLIDLIEKERLTAILNHVDAKVAAVPVKKKK